MIFMNVKKVNAFTDDISGGNPAGVVFDSPILSDMQMKSVSKILSVSETAYVYPSCVADYKTRFFSPTSEVDLCGHATIATFFTMAKEKIIASNKEKIGLDQETNAGILPIEILYKDGVVDRVMMTQSKPVFKGVHLSLDKITSSLNITKSEINTSLPEQIVSTGLFTCPLCVKTFETLKSMKPDFSLVKKLCHSMDVGSFHVFTFDTIEENSIYHARNFAPVYGINEDPVTGTANGAVCSYLYKNKIIDKKNLVCEQGDIIGRPGRVFVEIENNTVKVGGRAVFVLEKEIDME